MTMSIIWRQTNEGKGNSDSKLLLVYNSKGAIKISYSIWKRGCFKVTKYHYSDSTYSRSIPSWSQLKSNYNVGSECILLLNHKQVQAIIVCKLLYSKDNLWGDKDTDEYLLMLHAEDEKRIQDIMDVANSVNRSNEVSWYIVIFAFVLALATILIL